MTKPVETKLTYEPPGIGHGARGYWVVTYKDHELRFPREELFKTEKGARKFIARLEGGDK